MTEPSQCSTDRLAVQANPRDSRSELDSTQSELLGYWRPWDQHHAWATPPVHDLGEISVCLSISGQSDHFWAGSALRQPLRLDLALVDGGATELYPCEQLRLKFPGKLTPDVNFSSIPCLLILVRAKDPDPV
jgi:hypothetical protein